MNKKIGLCLVGIILLTGCTTNNETVYDEDGNLVLTMMSSWPENTPNGAGQSLYQAANDFSQMDNGIVIEIDGQDGYIAVDEKLQTEISAYNEPVMAQIEEASLARFDSALANLDDLLPEEVIDNYNPAFLKSSRNEDGELKVAPFNKSMPVLYVNMDLLNKEGYDVPETWEELVHTATDFHEKNPDKYGFASSWSDDIWQFESEYYSEGGTIDFSTNNVSFNDDKAKAIISTQQRMINDGVMPNPYATPNAEEIAYNEFDSGNALFKFESVSDYLTLKELAKEEGFDVQVYMQPAGQAGRHTVTGGSGFVILDSATSEEKAAAAEFIEYVNEDDIVMRTSLQSGYIPVTNSSVTTDTWKKFIEDVPDYQNVMNQIEYASVRPYSKNWTEIRDVIFDELRTDLANPNTDVAESLEIIDENIKQILGV